MMQRIMHFMCVVETNSQGQALGHRPFLWDASGLHDRPSAAADPTLMLVSQGKPVQTQIVKHWSALGAALIPCTRYPAQYQFVSVHSKPMFERAVSWYARKSGYDTGVFSLLSLDFIELLNSPAVLDLQDRRSWSIDRLAALFGGFQGRVGETESGGGLWDVAQVGQSLFELALVFTGGRA